MSLIVVEDQSPIMRRAKIRVVVAIVLLVVATSSLLMLNEQAPSLPTNTKTATAKPVTSKPKAAPVVANTSPPVSQSNIISDLPAKPPVTPPDPVYTSFTATPVAPPAAEKPVAEVSVQPPAPDPHDEKVVAIAAPEAVPKPKPSTPKITSSNISLDTSPTGTHILQVGVFSEMGNAKKQKTKLSASGIDSHTETKLKIGPFQTTEEAEAARQKILSAGIDLTLSDKIENSSRGQMLSGGHYADMDNAQRLQKAVSDLGISARTETRLLVGPFANKAKADAARNKIRNLNISVVLMPNNE